MTASIRTSERDPRVDRPTAGLPGWAARRRDEEINTDALTAMPQQIGGHNRAGGWRRLKALLEQADARR
jgi:hypothetical protein